MKILTPDSIAGAVARGWTTPENSHKEMDADLALAISEEIVKEIGDDCVMVSNDEEPHQEPCLGLATTRELLDEIRARIEVDGKLDYKTVGGGD